MGKRRRRRSARSGPNFMGNMKDTMGLGIGSMAGMGAVGALGATPGMPATGIPATMGGSLNLLNVGQMGKNAMSLSKMFK